MADDTRFEVISEGKITFVVHERVLRDKHTGVLYAYLHGGGGASLAMLRDENDKPIVKK